MSARRSSDDSPADTAKRPRLSPPADDNPSDPAPDSLIDHAAAIKYWSSTPATVSGVLGGYPALSRTDIQGSANFLAKLRGAAAKKEKLTRVADCGAGIGRITLGLLGKVATTVDVVEPVEQFCDVVRQGEEFAAFRGKVWQVGLEAWEPEERYELIWNQWCLGQLTDEQLVGYLGRSTKWLAEGGWIVVKENLSNHPAGADIFDDTDSSVTRTKDKFEEIFKRAGLKVVRTEVQRGFPKELYPVRIWGLQPV